MKRPDLWARQPPEPLLGTEHQRPGRAKFVPTLDDFAGVWQDKYWKNIPGPFYSTTDNMMSLLASSDAPSHLLYDDHCEFIWRQPATPREFTACVEAMYCDEVSSYAIDGNKRWSSQLVREWWKRREELVNWAREHLLRPRDDRVAFWRGSSDATDRKLLIEYVRYVEEDAEEYLRSYLFLLEEGRAARGGDVLPLL